MFSTSVAVYSSADQRRFRDSRLTLALLLEKHARLAYHDRNVTVNVGLAFIVAKGDGHIGIYNGSPERYAEHARLRLSGWLESFVHGPHLTRTELDAEVCTQRLLSVLCLRRAIIGR